MRIESVPFSSTDWENVEPTRHAGLKGAAIWRTQTFGDLRVRMVEYTPGYEADHWCEKGHVVLCVRGELETELHDGRKVILTPGQSYQVGDGVAPHRSSSPTGAVLFVVD